MNVIRKSTYRFLREKPQFSFLILIILLLMVGSGVFRLDVRLNPYDDDRDSESKVRKWMALSEEHFKDDQGIILFFHNPNRELTNQEVCRIEFWAHQMARQISSVKAWVTPMSIRQPRREDEKLWYRKSSGIDCDVNGFTSGNASANSGNENNESWKTAHQKLIQSPWSGTLLGPTAHEFAVQFVFDRDETSARTVESELVGKIKRAAQDFKNEELVGTQVHVAGPSSFSFHLSEAMRRDALINLLIVSILAIAFRAFFGTWKSSALYFITLIVTFIFSFGLMGWMGLSVNLLTNSMVMMTAIAGIEDFLFLCVLQARIKDTGDTKESAFAQMSTPAFWTTATTVLGFWSLGVSPVLFIREFGWASGFASLIEWGATFLFLPLLLKVFFQKTNWVLPERAWIRLPSAHVRWMRPNYAKVIALMGVAAGLFGFTKINFDDEPAKNFPMTHDQSKMYSYLRDSRQWTGQMELIFPWSVQTGKISAEKVHVITSQIAKLQGVTRTSDEIPFRDYNRRLVGEKDHALVQEEFDYSFVHALFNSDHGTKRAFVYTSSDALSNLRPTVESIRKICRSPECELSGRSIRYLEISDQVVPTLIHSFVTSLILVALVIFGLCHWYKIHGSVQLVISSFWGPFVMIGIISLFQIEINLVTSLFAAVIVGLAGDNAIQYIFASRKQDLRRGIENMGPASLLLAFLLSVCSAIFCLQTLWPLKILGGLLALAFVMNVFGDYFLLMGWLASGSSAGSKKNSDPG